METTQIKMNQTKKNDMEMNQIITMASRLSGLACPECASTSYRKHGKDGGIQRYQCKDCGRTFKETVNTPLHWIHHKEKMSLYIWTMKNRMSIRTAADCVEISKNTSFSWRHKLLSSLKETGTVSDPAPAGICEIKLPHSSKGKKIKDEAPKPETRSVLIADARGIPCLKLLQNKKPVNELAEILANKLHPSAEIAGLKSNILTRAKRKSGKTEIKHKARNKSIMAQAQKTVDELAGWMARFNGVATKYLQQYWDWFRVESNTESLERFESECFGQRQLQSYRKLIVT